MTIHLWETKFFIISESKLNRYHSQNCRFHILSYLIISYHILSYLIISYHILSILNCIISIPNSILSLFCLNFPISPILATYVVMLITYVQCCIFYFYAECHNFCLVFLIVLKDTKFIGLVKTSNSTLLTKVKQSNSFSDFLNKK